MLRIAPLVLALVSLPSAGASDAAAPYAPLWVASEAVDSATALVEWAPGTEQADAYRVYGVRGTVLTLLLETADATVPLATLLPAGYDTYAVSGVKGDEESAPVFAVEHIPLGCVIIRPDPPEAGLKECESRRALPVEVRNVPVL
jgi:hypothetical protein